MKTAALRTAELLCFLAGLFFLIPPPVSDTNYPHRPTPALIIGGSLFAVSLLLSWRRGAERWAIAFIKLGGYLILVWLAYECARMR